MTYSLKTISNNNIETLYKGSLSFTVSYLKSIIFEYPILFLCENDNPIFIYNQEDNLKTFKTLSLLGVNIEDYETISYDKDFWTKRKYDKNNNEIYFENSNGFWIKREYDENNNIIYHGNSDGFWQKREYDENNNEIYFENSHGFWHKREYDENNNLINMESGYK